jgi:hypothetical protein
MIVGTPLFLFQICWSFGFSQWMVMVIDTPSLLFQLYLTIFVVGDGD